MKVAMLPRGMEETYFLYSRMFELEKLLHLHVWIMIS